MKPKESTRQTIIQTGARLVHAKGFVNTGLQEILEASGVPKGSFYFYFKSKEDFGAALVDHYVDFLSAFIGGYMKDAGRSPLERIERFFDDSCRLYKRNGFAAGCPIGNLSQEMSDLSEPLRKKLGQAYGRMRELMRDCIAEAQEQGQIDMSWSAEDLAVFILNGWEGALIDMKLSKSVQPLLIFKKIMSDRILKINK